MGCETSRLKQANAETKLAELVIAVAKPEAVVIVSAEAVVASPDVKEETAIASPDVKEETVVASPDVKEETVVASPDVKEEVVVVTSPDIVNPVV
jgi:hypothetical protein